MLDHVDGDHSLNVSPIDQFTVLDFAAPSLAVSVGRVLVTPGALMALKVAGVTPEQLLLRHGRGDWGDLDAHDRAVNEQALLTGARLLSAYILPATQVRVWIITAEDRSVTTLLLPREY